TYCSLAQARRLGASRSQSARVCRSRFEKQRGPGSIPPGFLEEEEAMRSNLFDLSGKTALVTGGNSGIGLGFAEGVAKHGADVCIWGTNAEKNAAAVLALKEHGTKVSAIQCDVGDETQVERAFAQTLE